MSKDTSNQKTMTSDSSYWELDSHNADKFIEMIQAFFPEVNSLELSDFIRDLPQLMELNRIRKRFNVSYNELLSYMQKVKTIKTEGYGEVRTTIFRGHVTKIEGTMREILNQEQLRSM